MRAMRTAGIRHVDNDYVAELLTQQSGFIRTVDEVFQRWMTVIRPKVAKGPWTPEVRLFAGRGVRKAALFSSSRQEDAEVIRLVTLHGAKKWSSVAEHLPGRVGKQCRERCGAADRGLDGGVH